MEVILEGMEVILEVYTDFYANYRSLMYYISNLYVKFTYFCIYIVIYLYKFLGYYSKGSYISKFLCQVEVILEGLRSYIRVERKLY